MTKEIRYTFPALFQETLINHSKANALGYVDEEPITYSELNSNINSLINFLEKLGYKPNDKIAILSNNMPNWGIAYYAITFMGAIAVPLLPDFQPAEIAKILEHSEAKAVFVSENLKSKLFEIENVQKIGIESFTVIDSAIDTPTFEDKSLPEKKYTVDEEDLAALIYTSGTTGRPKGVMLSHKNISFTAIKGRTIEDFNENDRFLSVLPLSHTYENTLGLILPMTSGSCVYYLRKAPTAPVLLPALKAIKPTTMLTVPLIIEKLYRTKIRPNFNRKWITRVLFKFPPTRKVLSRIAGKRLYATFGGHLKFYGIGGAKLDPVVERFLKEARFPYAIGYGLTESAPLLAGSNPSNTIIESTGPAMEGVELKIVKTEFNTKEGEIWAKGPNVMKGYYKDPDLTSETITEDGWIKTGDLGIFKNNNLFIKGRLKNMIVGASGENIYPEEIESVINNFRYVTESLVVEEKGKLVALVHFNYEELEKKYKGLKEEVKLFVERKLDELKKELHDYVNREVNKFSKVQSIVLQPVPFQKTATKKIKRYLYTQR